jgi:hypothetical protein
MTARRRKDGVLQNLDGLVTLSLFVGESGADFDVLDASIEGQRFVANINGETLFDGTLDDLVSLLRNAVEYQRVREMEREVEEAWRVARESHAEAMQTAERLERVFGLAPIKPSELRVIR